MNFPEKEYKMTLEEMIREHIERIYEIELEIEILSQKPFKDFVDDFWEDRGIIGER